ncbi:MAG TPA: carboxypeptidase regulatory-like domain-containing protein [Candidatus Baltobacteraceae bacterium]|nr:carboxypeptidase regulatory-like domain-containing protein [Candidatus Baltobacteraceae bacterium]
MSNAYIRGIAGFALALVTFWGTLLDQTTNQPLTAVQVNATGPSTARASTNSRGKFTLNNLKPGHYTITVQSKDVPPQQFDYKITRSTTQTIKACSTTLDYHCAGPGGGPGGG